MKKTPMTLQQKAQDRKRRMEMAMGDKPQPKKTGPKPAAKKPAPRKASSYGSKVM